VRFPLLSLMLVAYALCAPIDVLAVAPRVVPVTGNSEKIIAADSIDIQCAGWGVLPEKN
jgi:hypothetical protein